MLNDEEKKKSTPFTPDEFCAAWFDAGNLDRGDLGGGSDA
jgi:hypothetical protein